VTGIIVVFGFLIYPARAQFLGFDRNDYPGDQNLQELRKDFSYAGYWLNNPPGANSNAWTGRRKHLQNAGFGFLVLFNGRKYSELGSTAHAAELGKSDAQKAANTARSEGFPPHTIIFLDQEEGGRLLPEQTAYLFAWMNDVIPSGFGVGVYCSGMAAKEASEATVVTADDIRRNAGGRRISYWVTNDSCPPSPGCTTKVPPPGTSGIDFADIWQFAQSPKRKDGATGCFGYNSDGNCYAGPPQIHLDLNTANTADPSHGRTQ
jgi:hypothetical protein